MTLPTRGLIAAAALFAADQLSKWAITGPMGIDQLGAVREVTSFFALRFVPNVGVSLGLLSADSDATRWAGLKSVVISLTSRTPPVACRWARRTAA